jgi:hypothetical protein
MPTAISRQTSLWLVHGPWGQRAFIILPSGLLPHEVIARELGILHGASEQQIEQLLQSRSWDAATRRWVEDKELNAPST